MFRITRDPSSGSFIQRLAKITVMVLRSPLTWTWSVLWQHICPWCVFVLHSLERHCVCTAQSREALKKRLDNTIEDVISAYTVLVRKPKEKTPVRRHVAQV